MTTSGLSKLIRAGLLASALAVFASVASAQNTNTNAGGNTNTAARRADDGDNDRDWGWIGLIGLAGLAGLLRRRDAPREGYRPNETTRRD